jgi:hypothetical protein
VYVVGRAYNRTIVVGIGDPLAARADWPAMLRAFRTAFPIATFAHIGPDFARLVKEQEGMPVTDMGAETNIMVQTWAYSKRTRTIRNAARDARSLGYRVREVKQGELTPEVCKQLAHVTGEERGRGLLAGAGLGGARPVAAARGRPGARSSGRRAGPPSTQNPFAPNPFHPPLTRAPHRHPPPHKGDWVQKKAVGDQMLRVFIRHVDYNALHLDNGVRLFVAESFAPAAGAGKEGAASPAKEGGGAASPAGKEGGGAAGAPSSSGRSVVEGFVMVDPLWRDGEVFGYVTSLNRMRQGAHHGALGAAAGGRGACRRQRRPPSGRLERLVAAPPLRPRDPSPLMPNRRTPPARLISPPGTLKLLYEEIFALAKAEGREMVSFGFSPFFNLQVRRRAQSGPAVRRAPRCYRCPAPLRAPARRRRRRPRSPSIPQPPATRQPAPRPPTTLTPRPRPRPPDCRPAQTKPFCGPFWAEHITRFLFNFGNNLYQFKNLAFSKAR